MEQTGKIDIKSELIRAGAPFVVKGVRRFRELSKIQILKYYLILYAAVGYILQGVLGAIPDLLMSAFGFSGTWLHLVIWLFWPIVMFALISQEDAIFSFVLLVAFASFIAHLRQKVSEVQALNIELEQKIATLSLEPPLISQRDYLPSPRVREPEQDYGPARGSRPVAEPGPYYPEEPHARHRYEDERPRSRYEEPPRPHYDGEPLKQRYEEERPRPRYQERPRPQDAGEGETFEPE